MEASQYYTAVSKNRLWSKDLKEYKKVDVVFPTHELADANHKWVNNLLTIPLLNNFKMHSNFNIQKLSKKSGFW